MTGDRRQGSSHGRGARFSGMAREKGAERIAAWDLGERMVVLAIYLALLWRLWPAALSATGGYARLLLMSEGLVVVLLLLRRPARRLARRPSAWAIAFAGTVAPLLVRAGAEAPIAPRLAAGLLLAGLMLHLGAKLSLWRRFGVVPADRGVCAHGLYRLVRHPMYLGYMITHIGFLLAQPSLWNAAVYGFGWGLLALRIRLEEELLSANADYRRYMRRTRWRLLPGLY